MNQGASVNRVSSIRLQAIRLTRTLTRVLVRCCTYGLPTLLVLFTLIVIFLMAPPAAEQGWVNLPIQAVEKVEVLSPEMAIREARLAIPRTSIETNRAEHPFWILFELPGVKGVPVIELPSRHALDVACWNASTIELLGEASRINISGRLKAIKGGFSLDVNGIAAKASILCRGTYRGPANIEIRAWNEDDLSNSMKQFSRSSGLLDGAGLMLVLLMFAIATFNREPLYAMLGAWLLGNLRMGAISAGMDFDWLGYPIPYEWLYSVRKITCATYYMLTVLVFGGLFRAILTTRIKKIFLRLMVWSIVPVMLAAITLPYASFLPILWIGSLGVTITQFVILVGLPRSRWSAITVAFAGALILTLAGSLSEIIAAATGWRSLLGILNSVTGALASSFLGAVAMAAHVRRERSQRLAAQKAAIKALDRVQDTYRASPVGLFTLDESAQFIRFNPALCQMLGYGAEHASPIVWIQHFSEDQYAQLCAAPVGQSFEAELIGRNFQGEERAFLVHAAPGESLIEGSIQDVTERRAAVDKLRFLAEHDPLTSLLNRRGIEQVLERALVNASRGKSAAIAYIDLDRFKLVNDLYGHPTGDEVLRQLTQRMSYVLGVCPLARVGGDEFVVVFADMPLDAARKLCEEMLHAICDTPVEIENRVVRIEGSIGLCEVEPGINVHDAIATADRACRDAKRERTGSLVVYEQAAAAYKDRAQEIAIIEQLSSSPVLPGLFLEMQPVMSLTAPFDSLNFEVLLRMNSPENKLLPTVKVIGALETSGMMPMVDRWVMRETLSWLETHCERLVNTNFVCMNLSGVSLNDERFIADAMSMLAEFPRAARMLCLEITETVALHDLGNTRRWIEKLRQHGVKVALDDFGAGYSSFTYLRDLPADSLKIDGAFIKTINQHPANHAIVQVIIELAANLGMRTVAEWAEDRQTLETLAGLGAHYAQGWAIAKPQKPEAILQATSAASFIKDEETLRTIREFSDESKWGKLKDRLFPLGNRSSTE